MRFPEWVDGPRKNKTQRASSRLKFILSKVALELTGSSGMRKLADQIGLDYSLFYKYIKAGAFSARSAAKIEESLGKKVIKAVHLTNPLDIVT